MLRMVLIVLGIFLFQGRVGAVSVDTEIMLLRYPKIWKYPAIWEKPAVLP